MLPPEPTNLDLLLDRALAMGAETSRFEFKEQLDFANNPEHKVKLLKAIGAFRNTDHGGYLIIGVSDDRQVVGVLATVVAAYDQTRVQRMASGYFAPAPTLQVRHHQRQGKLLIVVEVPGFVDVPSIVRRTETQGAEKLQAGTFLTRTGAAESALLTGEAEIRALCDAIAARRSQQIVEAVRSLQSKEATDDPRRRVLNGLAVIRAEADRMAKHARSLNIELQTGRGRDYIPLLFRPALLESALPAALDEIGADNFLMEQLAFLRNGAAAADEGAAKIMAGARADRQLVNLVLNVGHSATMVSEAIGRKLAKS